MVSTTSTTKSTQIQKDVIPEYQKYRPYMQTGDSLLFSGDDFLSRLVRWRTKSDYSHVGLVVRHDEYDCILVVEALERGPFPYDLDKRVKNYNGEIHWYPLENVDYQTRVNIAKWALRNSGGYYDYMGLAMSAFTYLYRKKDKHHICSEFHRDAFELGGGLKVNFPKNLVPYPKDIPHIVAHESFYVIKERKK